jgi:hypothetical protein
VYPPACLAAGSVFVAYDNKRHQMIVTIETNIANASLATKTARDKCRSQGEGLLCLERFIFSNTCIAAAGSGERFAPQLATSNLVQRAEDLALEACRSAETSPTGSKCALIESGCDGLPLWRPDLASGSISPLTLNTFFTAARNSSTTALNGAYAASSRWLSENVLRLSLATVAVLVLMLIGLGSVLMHKMRKLHEQVALARSTYPQPTFTPPVVEQPKPAVPNVAPVQPQRPTTSECYNSRIPS